MAEKRHPHVVNINEVEAIPLKGGKKFDCLDRRLAEAAGGRGIGCSYYEVPPGKCAFPFHYHCQNDESVFVVDGEGTMRIGDARVPVKAGDYIAFPLGPDGAHQLENTGSTTLKYLCMSTMHTVDIVGYPDSKKFGASAAQSVEAIAAGKRWVRHLWKEAPPAGYYDGEE